MTLQSTPLQSPKQVQFPGLAQNPLLPLQFAYEMQSANLQSKKLKFLNLSGNLPGGKYPGRQVQVKLAAQNPFPLQSFSDEQSSFL